ncbi:Ger(x)C family spore germination protein [Paenibacillus sp. PL91]|uniref:Ger(x)C family spore germination protein n=1 Tax=Paenibacillus sp. PL91 TaxID=2729538 RepID=UPI00145D7B16|nr:Ger(x)C family spore germination protein [Paenibacillus sp. PL91]MBC9203887.1 Ger(x)C family spore germination protein [Paenibacillus sp. PL91]
MSSMKRLLLIPFMGLLILTGCSNENVIDHIRILTVLGFDKSGSGYTGSALYSDYEEKGKIKVLQGKAKQTRVILKDMAFQSTQPIRVEKLKMLAFSKEVVNEGLSAFLKTICRDPLISNYVILAVFDESLASVSESLAGKGSQEFPYHLIEQNMKREMIPYSNLSTVLFDFYGTGRDFSMPYLKLNSKKDIEISGYGIFKDDRLKLVLSPEEMVYFKLLQGDALRGDIPFVIKKGSNQSPAIFTVNSGKLIRKVTLKQNETKVTYTFVLSGMVNEYPDWFSLNVEENTHSIIKQLEKQIQSHLHALLYKFVKEEVDPLGIGDLMRSRQRGWTEEKFYMADYEKIKFDVQFSTHLSKSGVGE